MQGSCLQVLIAVILAVVLPGAGSAQSTWQVQVRDLVTNQGIPDVVVEARTSRVAGSTDAQGFVELAVTADHESVVVHGADGYGYQVGDYPVCMPRVVYLVPDTAYHATPLIPVTGTGAPVVFQGTTWTPFGPNAYTIEVEVPPDVLPRPASFRIAPVPVYASPLPAGSDPLIHGAMAQFAVKLVDADGRALTEVLPEPGIIVRCSPTWYTYAQMANLQGRVNGVQYRLTKTSASWAAQPDTTYWDPANGMFTAHLRACSWWLLYFAPLLLSGDTYQGSGGSDAQVPPPAPEITIERDACVTSGVYDSGIVTCGKLQMPVTCTIANNGTMSFNAQFQAGMAAELGVSPSQLARLVTRINAQVSGTLTMNAGGGFTFTASGSAGGTTPAQVDLGYPCHSGTYSAFVVKRKYTFKRGTNTFEWSFAEGVGKIMCLKFQQSCCQESPWTGDIVQTIPPGLVLCEGDVLNCQ